MKRYRIQAIYHAFVELEVEVTDDTDPKDPRNWNEIISEQQVDYHLYDTTSAEEIEDN